MRFLTILGGICFLAMLWFFIINSLVFVKTHDTFFGLKALLNLGVMNILNISLNK